MRLNECFKRTCKVLLQEDVGELEDFQALLKRYVDPLRKSNSFISGKETYYAEPYGEGSRFVSFDEVENIKAEPFSINEIKDIDGLLNAASERFRYAGNKIMGKSLDVMESESCIDAVNVFQSHKIYNSENMAYCQMVLDSKYLFGCSWGVETNFCINTTEMYRATRCFESAYMINSRDVYFSYNCKDCSEALFCFNQYSKRFSIGNNQLPRDTYAKIKKNVLSDICEMLREKKTVPHLVGISGGW